MTKVVRRGLHTYGYLLIIATIITVFAALTTVGVSAVGFDTHPYTYNDEEGVTITGFYGLNGGETVVIPATIEGKKVLAIGLETVPITIPVESAANIGGLNLTEAKNLKVINHSAFYGCKDLYGTIESNTVEVVEPYAFRGTGLTSVDLPELETVGEDAFNGCTGLTSLNLPELTTVGEAAFEDCTGLTSFDAPKVTKVGAFAFRDTGLTSLNLPALKTVGAYAFNGCTGLTSLNLPALTMVINYAFEGCTELTSVDLPELETVGDYAFNGCTGLTSLNLPALTRVGAYAFEGCTELTSVDLPELKTVGAYAFLDCSKLTFVWLEKHCKIYIHAFMGTPLEKYYEDKYTSA